MPGDQPRSEPGTPRCYRMFGYRFALEVEDAAVAARVARVLEPFPADDARPAHVYRLSCEDDAPIDPWILTRDGVLLSASPDGDAVVEYLIWHINTQALQHAPDRLLIHAGSIVAPGGGAVVLVGPSGAGKSTTVTALVRAGWGYLSDELAVVDPASRLVEPHPRLVHLKAGSPALPPEHVEAGRGAWHLPPDDVRPGAAAAEPYPLAAVVRLDPARGDDPVISDISSGEAASALVAHVLNAQDHRGRLLPLVRDVALAAVTVSLARGDLDRSVALLTERLSTPVSA